MFRFLPCAGHAKRLKVRDQEGGELVQDDNPATVDERPQLADLFQQAPGFMAMLRGPDHVFEHANAAYRRLVGGRDVIGKPVREALPDIDKQGFFELLDGVYSTGEPYVGEAVPITFAGPDGAVALRHVDFLYQPIRGEAGAVVGIVPVDEGDESPGVREGHSFPSCCFLSIPSAKRSPPPRWATSNRKSKRRRSSRCSCR